MRLYTYLSPFCRSSITVLVVICCALTGGLAVYWDPLHGMYHTCDTIHGEAIYSVQSVKCSSCKEDPRWMWQCKTIVPGLAMSHCYWGNFQNQDKPFLFRCPVNYVLSGVHSVHSNKKEDRSWRFYCCIASGYCTNECYWSSFINNWDGGDMKYGAPYPWFLTGAQSYYSNIKK